MSWRRQLPVHSPLSLGALVGGLGAAVSGGGGAKSRIEAWIQERFGSRQVLLIDSGTSALALAMQAAVGRLPGKPILLPSYGCYDVVTAAMAAGVQVRWYDIDPATLQPDWPSLAGAHSRLPGAAAIVLVHHYGLPADIARLRAMIGNHADRPLIIEDAAQAIGGSLEAGPLGGFGDFGVLSFGRGKGMTGGGGGALLGNSPEAARPFDSLGSGLDPAERGGGSLVSTGAQWLLARPSMYALPASLPFLQLGTTVFRAPHAPRRMSASHAGVLAGTLQYGEAEAATRRRNAARLVGIAQTWSIPVTAGQAGYLRFPILLPEALAGLRESPEARRLGIMAGYPVPLPELSGSPFAGAAAPGATRLARQLITIPVHSLVSENDFVRIEHVLGEWRSRD